MPEVEIIIQHSVRCPQFANTKVLLTLCRHCPEYRYETCDLKVLCNYTGPQRLLPPRPRDRGPKPLP